MAGGGGAWEPGVMAGVISEGCGPLWVTPLPLPLPLPLPVPEPVGAGLGQVIVMVGVAQDPQVTVETTKPLGTAGVVKLAGLPVQTSVTV